MTARAKDHDEIVRVMQLYVDGFNDNDVGKFKEAFHDNAWIFYVDADGRLTKNPNLRELRALGRAAELGRCRSDRSRWTQVGRRRFGADRLGPDYRFRLTYGSTSIV